MKHPSTKLSSLIQLIENAVVSVLGEKIPDADTIFIITENLEKLSPVPYVGCKEHELLLTRRVISFYLTTRMFFVAKQCNRNNEERERTKEKRKAAKLTTASTSIFHETNILMKKPTKRKAPNTSTDLTISQKRRKKLENNFTLQKAKKEGVQRTLNENNEKPPLKMIFCDITN